MLTGRAGGRAGGRTCEGGALGRPGEGDLGEGLGRGAGCGGGHVPITPRTPGGCAAPRARVQGGRQGGRVEAGRGQGRGPPVLGQGLAWAPRLPHPRTRAGRGRGRASPRGRAAGGILGAGCVQGVGWTRGRGPMLELEGRATRASPRSEGPLRLSLILN